MAGLHPTNHPSGALHECLPQFHDRLKVSLAASRVEFFNLFDIKIENEVRLHEYIYIIVLVLFSYFVYAMGVSLVTLIIIDGSIISFTYVIAFPIWLHFKCLFYDHSCGFIEGDEENNRAILINRC